MNTQGWSPSAFLDALQPFAAIDSISSDEDALRCLLKERYRPYCDELVGDRLGSLFAHRRAKAEKKDALRLLIAFPLDEIGLMVEDIDANGRLRFLTLEALSPASLLHQPVHIHTADGAICPGIICAEHRFLEEAISHIEMSDLYIDTGLDAATVQRTVCLGDLVSLRNAPRRVGNCLAGSALDQKALALVSCQLLEKLSAIELPYDLYLGGIAQSMVGFRGTKTATYVVEPDAAIALTSFEVRKSCPAISLGEGTVVGRFDRQMLPNRSLLQDFLSNCPAHSAFQDFGNDGSFIHKTLRGTPCFSMGFPAANRGTAQVILHPADVKALVNDLASYLQALTDERLRACLPLQQPAKKGMHVC